MNQINYEKKSRVLPLLIARVKTLGLHRKTITEVVAMKI